MNCPASPNPSAHRRPSPSGVAVARAAAEAATDADVDEMLIRLDAEAWLDDRWEAFAANAPISVDLLPRILSRGVAIRGVAESARVAVDVMQMLATRFVSRTILAEYGRTTDEAVGRALERLAARGLLDEGALRTIATGAGVPRREPRSENWPRWMAFAVLRAAPHVPVDVVRAICCTTDAANKNEVERRAWCIANPLASVDELRRLVVECPRAVELIRFAEREDVRGDPPCRLALVAATGDPEHGAAVAARLALDLVGGELRAVVRDIAARAPLEAGWVVSRIGERADGLWTAEDLSPILADPNLDPNTRFQVAVRRLSGH